MWLRTSCDITFDVSVPTPFILMLRPRSGAHQRVAHEDCTLTPSVPVTEYVDSYGNLCERLIAPPGEFSIRRSADVSTADGIDVSPGAPFDEVHNLPDEVLAYLLPSRYCESDRFIDLGRELVDGVEPGYHQVARIVGWIRTFVRSIQISAIFRCRQSRSTSSARAYAASSLIWASRYPAVSVSQRVSL